MAADVTRFFHPVLAARKLRRKPVRVLVDGEAYVLFRDASGRPAALLDACPHRRAPLSSGHVRPDGRIACPYHGWHFDADGHGCSPSQPSLKCDTRAMQVVEREGYLFLASRDASLADFPELGWPEYHFGGAYTMLFRAPLHVALDNFSEDEHTPWVHTRLGWNETDAGVIDFDAHNFDDRTEVRYSAPQRPSPLLPLLFVQRGDLFHNNWVTRFDPVRTVYSLHWTDGSGARERPFAARAVIFMVPEDERTTRFHVLNYVRVTDSRFARFTPIVKRAATALGFFEVWDDARFIPTVANTPFEMKGMRLGKYDKPLVHNHKLLRSIYWGERPPSGLDARA